MKEINNKKRHFSFQVGPTIPGVETPAKVKTIKQIFPFSTIDILGQIVLWSPGIELSYAL